MSINCDPNALSNLAKCFQCLSPATLQQIQIYLLCQIGSSALVTGAGNFSGSGSPNGVVTANAGATYVDTVTGSLYWKSTSGTNTGWVETLANLNVINKAIISTPGTTNQTTLEVVQDSNAPADSTNFAQMEIHGFTVPARRLAIGYDTTGNYGYIQALETLVSYRNLALNPTAGNVGIGISVPLSPLDVVGNIHSSTGFLNGASNIKWVTGAGDPNNVVTAPVGSLYSRTDGGALTSLYVKESGAGNTGWVGK